MIQSFRRIILAGVATLSVATLFASTRYVGYCKGILAETGYAKAGKCDMSAAIELTPEMLEPYRGAVITGVRIGLVTPDGLSRLRGWVRTALDGDTIALDSISTWEKGWNTIPVKGGAVVNPDAGKLVVGFTYSQPSSVRTISIAGPNNPNGKWYAKNGVWEQSTSTGSVGVELIVEHERFAAKDVILKKIALDPPVAKPGEAQKILLTVSNDAPTEVNGFDYSVSIDGSASVSGHSNAVIQTEGEQTLSLDFSPKEVLTDHPYVVEGRVSCEGDGDSTNNTNSCITGYYATTAPRRVLIEEFTTEKCMNCPRAATTLLQCEQNGYADKMALVAHHSGYNTDWLTTTTDRDYLWFYHTDGSTSTFAPACMLDRVTPSGKGTPVRNIGYFADFEPTLKEATERPAFVGLNVESRTEPNGDITLEVEATKLPLLDAVCTAPRISVAITENNIAARSQAGAGDGYTHRHVFRERLTDLWGDPFEWNGNTCKWTYTFTPAADWKRENLGATVFVHGYSLTDVNQCEVFNSAVAEIGESGLEVIQSAADSECDFYTVTGHRISNPDNYSGICIRRPRRADIPASKVIL